MLLRTEEDRRKARRYKVDESLFLVVRPEFDILGRVKDISSGGLSFEYGAYCASVDREKIEIDIFSEARSLRISKIVCSVVHDKATRDASPYSGLSKRKCGLRFGKLTRAQAVQVSILLQSQMVAARQKKENNSG